MNKKVFTLLEPDLYTNVYNWSFWDDRALVRVEDKSYKSKIVEYKFNINEPALTNPKTILEHPHYGYEDPRLINKNDFTYVKYDRKAIKCFFMNNKGPLTKGHAWEKNWQHLDKDEYIYRIRPFIIRNKKNRDRYNYYFDWKYGDILHLSSEFKINERQFIIFHTYISKETKRAEHAFSGQFADADHSLKNERSYYQGVIELVDLKPKFYIPTPLFEPPPLDNQYKFPKNKNRCIYVMCTKNIKDNLYISAGRNDCESILIKIKTKEFLEWVDDQKLLVDEMEPVLPSNVLKGIVGNSNTNIHNTITNYNNLYRIN